MRKNHHPRDDTNCWPRRQGMSLDSCSINGPISGRLYLRACQVTEGVRASDFIPVDAVFWDVQSNNGPQQPKNRFIQPVVQSLLNTFHIPGIY